MKRTFLFNDGFAECFIVRFLPLGMYLVKRIDNGNCYKVHADLML